MLLVTIEAFCCFIFDDECSMRVEESSVDAAVVVVVVVVAVGKTGAGGGISA